MTVRLPPALVPWKAELALLWRDLAGGIGPWLPRLALLFGPLATPRTGRGGEPDGFDGLARRGPYDRLLASEWLLAGEVPDEFVRRAAMNEHLFLARAFVSPHGSRRSVALFDAGPEQLGAPRIVQLAALIVLARRAAVADLELAWGILQEPPARLEAGLDGGGLLRFARARTGRPVTPEHLEGWTARLVPEDEVWLLGGRSLARVARPSTLAGAGRLVVEDGIEPETRRVTATLLAGGAERRLTLDLPDPRACARILRDPAARTPAPGTRSPGRVDARARVLLAKRRLDVRTLEGLVSLPIPNSPLDDAGRPRPFVCARGEQVVGVGWHRRRHVIVTWLDDRLLVHGMPGAARAQVEIPVPPWAAFFPPGPHDALAPCVFRQDGPATRVLVTDAAGRLFDVELAPRQVVERLPYRVVAMTRREQRIHFVGEALDGAGSRVIVQFGPERHALGLPIEADSPDEEPFLEAHFGSHVNGLPGLGILAVRCGRERWRVFYGAGGLRILDLHVHEKERVFGVASLGDDEDEPGLVIAQLDRHTLGVVGRRAFRKLAVASSPILHAVASDHLPYVAYVAESGELAVIRTLDGAVLLRHTLEAQ